MTPEQMRELADRLTAGTHYVDSPELHEAMMEAADYLRACADAKPVPAGWKPVPVEPTPEMLSAVGMMDGYDWHAPGCSPDADHANWYSAMIAAAPAVPQAEPHRNQPLRDLLAVIHCDGGHHTEAVGIEQSIKDALSAVCVLKGKLAQAEPKREPLSDERIAEIQRAAYERAAQECIETAAELRRCADGCTDGRYDWKADGALDCADAISALGRQ